MIVIFLIIFATVIFVIFPMFRLVVFHPVKIIYHALNDFYQYLKKKKINEAIVGRIICFCGLFGKGKTLSAVKYVVDFYERFNDVYVFDFKRLKFVKQKVHVMSNVSLNIPFEYLKSLEQIVYVAEKYKKYDEKNNVRTVHIALIDEASVQLNSRDWKKNIDAYFLNTILTCRHHFISIVLTAQRFNHLDSLLRQVCTTVIQVNKKWRFQLLSYYDAYELEHTSNPEKLKPYFKTGFIIEQKHFDSYDTLACVENLKKDIEKNNRLTEKEILDLQRNQEIVCVNNEKK